MPDTAKTKSLEDLEVDPDENSGISAALQPRRRDLCFASRRGQKDNGNLGTAIWANLGSPIKGRVTH